MDLKKLQKQVYNHKAKRGFNVKDVSMEFCLLSEELSEAYRAYYQKEDNLGEELADVFIYLLGLAEILKVDLEKEFVKKMEKNKNRVYKKNKKGVLVKQNLKS
ncbi:MAG: hypothetical protein K9M44_03570 [Candidatus Pacebacteria bacterium]|nr:hypothetical protein [Candidatus Paceibacterota bacterium]